MKTITIYQPWAEKIVSGQKFVENRPRRTGYRGMMAILAGVSKQFVRDEDADDYTYGAVIGVAELTACLSLRWCEEHAEMAPKQKPPTCGYTYSEIVEHQYTQGPVLLIFERPRRLLRPIPFRGQQYFFDVPDDLIAEAGFHNHEKHEIHEKL